MKTRTSLILAVVALALAAFIYFVERDLPTTEELENRSDRVLPGFDRDRVSWIELGQGEGRLRLERDEVEAQPDAGPGVVGQWRLTQPRALPADPEAVDSLLSAIDWLERRRAVEEPGAATKAQFGLAEPRAQVKLELRDRELTLSVGGEAPAQGLYLALSSEPNKAYVVDREFLEQVTKEIGDLRDKRLVTLETNQVEAVRLKGRFHALRQSGDANTWRLETPVAMRADRGRVEDVIRDVERLRAKRYVADDVEEGQLERYGLAQPSRELTLRLEGQEQPLTLRLGGRCEGHGEEIYATTLGTGTVACVSADFLDELDVEPDSLRDMRPTTLDADDLQRLSIVRGAERLELRKRDNRWHLAGGEDGSEEGPLANGESLEALLTALSDAQASDITQDLSSSGLDGDDPRADVVVRLWKGDAEAPDEVLYFAVETGQIFLRRGDEGVALVLSIELDEQLSASPLRFRDRRVLDETASDAVELEVTLGSERQLLRKRETRWWLVSPFEYAADDAVVREVVRSVAHLEAERFVTDRPSAAQGLSQPRVRLRVTFASSPAGDADAGGAEAGAADAGGADASGAEGARREHLLLIGAEAEGGAYAKLDGRDQPVFVLPQALVDQLLSPLLDRDLFAIEEDRVESLTLELSRGQIAAPIELRRQGDRWMAGQVPAPDGAVDAILSRLAIARASEVISLGAPAPRSGLEPPRGRVTLGIGATEGEEGTSEQRVYLIGDEYGEEDQRRVYARREGVDATFGLPLRVVRPIFEFEMSPSGDAGAAEDEVDSGDASE